MCHTTGMSVAQCGQECWGCETGTLVHLEAICHHLVCLVPHVVLPELSQVLYDRPADGVDALGGFMEQRQHHDAERVEAGHPIDELVEEVAAGTHAFSDEAVAVQRTPVQVRGHTHLVAGPHKLPSVPCPPVTAHSALCIG